MTLREWLDNNEIKPWRFAKEHGFCAPHIYQYLNGDRNIGPNTAVRIEEATNGEVDRRDALWPK